MHACILAALPAKKSSSYLSTPFKIPSLNILLSLLGKCICQKQTKYLAKKEPHMTTHVHAYTNQENNNRELSRMTPSSFLQSGSGHLLFTVIPKRLKIS